MHRHPLSSSGNYIFKVSFDLLQSEKESSTSALRNDSIALSIERFVSCFSQQDISNDDKFNTLLYVLPSLYRLLSQSIDTSGASSSTNKIVVKDEELCGKILGATCYILSQIAANSEIQHMLIAHKTNTPEVDGTKSDLLQVLNNIILLLTFLCEAVSRAASSRPDTFEDLILGALRVYNAYMTALLSMSLNGNASGLGKRALSPQVVPQVMQTFLQYCSSGGSGVRAQSALNTIALITFVDRVYGDKDMLLAYFPGVFSRLHNALHAKPRADSKTRSYCLVAIMTIYKFCFSRQAGCTPDHSASVANHLDFIKSLQFRATANGTAGGSSSASSGGHDSAIALFEKANSFFLASANDVFNNAASVKTKVVMLQLLRDILLFVLSCGEAFAAKHVYSYAMLVLPSTISEYASVREVASEIYRKVSSSPSSHVLAGSKVREAFLSNFVGIMRKINSKAPDIANYQSLNLDVLELISIMLFLRYEMSAITRTCEDALTKLFEALLACPQERRVGTGVFVDSKMYRCSPSRSYLGKYYRAQSDVLDADVNRTVRKLCYSFGKVEGGVAFLADNIVKYNIKTKDAVSGVRRRGKHALYYIHKSITFYTILNFAYFGFVHKWLDDDMEAVDPYDLLTSPLTALLDASHASRPLFINKMVGISCGIVRHLIDNRDIFESYMHSYSILISLVLENVALIFYYFGRQKSESLLITFLYDIIVLTSDTSNVICTAAETTLHLISMYLNYTSLPFMLFENFDFLIERSYAKFKIQKQAFYNDSSAIDTKNAAFYNSFNILNFVFSQIGDIVKNDSAATVSYSQKIRLYVVDLLRDIIGYIDFSSSKLVVSNLQISSFLSLINIIFTKIINVIFINSTTQDHVEEKYDNIDDNSYSGDVLKLTNPIIRSFIANKIAVSKRAACEGSTSNECGKNSEDLDEYEMGSDEEYATADSSNDEIVKIMIDTLKRLIYFMTLENLKDRVLIIQVIYEMIKILKENNIQKISNIIYQIWPHIIEILKKEVDNCAENVEELSEKATKVGSAAKYTHNNASNIVIGRTLDLCSFILFSSGDFFAVRFDDYLLPIVSRLLHHFFTIESNSSTASITVDYKKKTKSLRLTNDFEILISLLKLVEGLGTKNRDQFNCDYVAYFTSFIIPFLSSDQTPEVRGIVFKILDNFVSRDYTYSLYLYNLVSSITTSSSDSKTIPWTDIFQRGDVVSFLSNPKLRRAIELANGSSVNNSLALSKAHLKNLIALAGREDGGVLRVYGGIVSKNSLRSFEDAEIKSHIHNAKWFRELVSRSYL